MLQFQQRLHTKTIAAGNKYVLAGDIGGTNTTLAIALPGKRMQLIASFRFQSKAITNFATIVKGVTEYCQKKWAVTVSSACFAGAGPCNENVCQITHLPWKISRKEILKATSLKEVTLINDFEAIGYGIDVLPKKDMKIIKKGTSENHAVRCLLGAGTGLGKSILTWDGSNGIYTPLPSEGGHGDFPAFAKAELQLVMFIAKEREQTYVAWEDVLSGKGISNIYQYLALKGEKTEHSSEIERNYYNPALITKYSEEDKICKQTMEWFVRFYARCAKNLALDSLSFGGVYIAGGIAAKHHKLLKRKLFEEEFLNNSHQHDILKEIPVHVITNYDVSLFGAAAVAKLNMR